MNAMKIRYRKHSPETIADSDLALRQRRMEAYLRRTHSEFVALVDKVANTDTGGILAGPRVRIAQRKG